MITSSCVSALNISASAVSQPFWPVPGAGRALYFRRYFPNSNDPIFPHFGMVFLDSSPNAIVI